MAEAGTLREGRSGHECLRGSPYRLAFASARTRLPKHARTSRHTTQLLAGRSAKEATMTRWLICPQQGLQAGAGGHEGTVLRRGPGVEGLVITSLSTQKPRGK